MTLHRPAVFGDAQVHAASLDERAPERQFDGKVAVVTGSTQGLGLATAELMLRRGAAGIVLCGRNAEAGRREAARLSEGGGKVVFQQADLADLNDCAALLERTAETFGAPDVLVNAAGITDRGGVLDANADLWRRTFDINARAPFFLMQAAARAMIAADKPGAIVNVASVVAHGGPPSLAVYAASKAALVALTRNAAFSLARDGIRVNALAIGWMDTPAEDLTQRRFHGLEPGWQQREGAKLPSGRLLAMPEVARWVAHLAGPESGIMTGSVIDFDHGVTGCYEATPLPAERD